MFSGLTLPFPDGPVWLSGVILVLVVSLAALLVWQRDRRAVEPPANAEAPAGAASVARPAAAASAVASDSQPDAALSSALSGSEREPTSPRDVATVALPGRSVSAVVALTSIIATFEHALSHSFTLEAAPGLETLTVEEPGFSLACAALLLHAAQGSFAHTLSVRPMTRGDALYTLDLLPSVIVEVRSPPETTVSCDGLALRALDACDQAGGAGSIADPSKLWLVWPAQQPASLAAAAVRSEAAGAQAHV